MNPHQGEGLKVNSPLFLGYPEGQLPLFTIAKLLAGDINVNPGHTQYFGLNLSFDSQSSDDVYSYKSVLVINKWKTVDLIFKCP